MYLTMYSLGEYSGPDKKIALQGLSASSCFVPKGGKRSNDLLLSQKGIETVGSIETGGNLVDFFTELIVMMISTAINGMDIDLVEFFIYQAAPFQKMVKGFSTFRFKSSMGQIALEIILNRKKGIFTYLERNHIFYGFIKFFVGFIEMVCCLFKVFFCFFVHNMRNKNPA